jgi:pimeloyl-ACP methyl ester carboxylesterase
MADAIPGARYIELPGCGHCPPLEQPEVFIQAIADFVLADERR